MANVGEEHRGAGGALEWFDALAGKSERGISPGRAEEREAFWARGKARDRLVACSACHSLTHIPLRTTTCLSLRLPPPSVRYTSIDEPFLVQPNPTRPSTFGTHLQRRKGIQSGSLLDLTPTRTPTTPLEPGGNHSCAPTSTLNKLQILSWPSYTTCETSLFRLDSPFCCLSSGAVSRGNATDRPPEVSLFQSGL